MPDLGSWVIVAAIAWPGGHIDSYTPTTQFDQPACIAEAQAINHRWRDAQIVGFATCRKAQP
jgi:hypothetical protein